MSEAQARLEKKEKIRSNILVGCGIAGGLMGGLLGYYAAVNDDSHAIFGNSPIPTIIAIIFAIFWAIIMPIICHYWYKYVDEQEMHSTRIGAFYALYIYMIGAPTWWVLWRGGLVSEPNGIIIYLITVAAFCIIWMWKKRNG